ncbi:MAG: tetratricopeptide repeat protein [Leptospirales bacterium]|nr:tetratricopeptide repeat protein [Leptospirales bacterium]
MKKLSFLFILLFLAKVSVCFAQEEAAEKDTENQLSLEQVADDQKFGNGMNFMTLKKYDKALEEFLEYLEIYYNGSHRSEVYAKIAGIYFDRQYYLKAINYYKGLYEEFSDTDEGLGGYYNIGVCYVKMGYDKQALEIFSKILQEHPTSQQAAKAQIQMELLEIFKK